MVLRGTKEYSARAADFAVSADEARELLAAHLRMQNPGRPSFIGYHDVIVSNCYVFSAPEKDGISLDGYYVNGVTREVTRVRDERRIPIWKAKFLGWDTQSK